MSNQNTKMMQRDLEVIWHPCTQMKDHETLPLVPIKSGKGVYLYDFDGNAYIDAVSSWWVNIFGHANESINNKVKAQIDTLEHVLLAGFTHEPAIELAHKLVNITPKDLAKVFYVDNGSSAVEAALKMGFSKNDSKILVSKTFEGAVELFNQSDLSPNTWMERVASKGGTTRAALDSMDDNNVKELIKDAAYAAFDRAVELGNE